MRKLIVGQTFLSVLTFLSVFLFVGQECLTYSATINVPTSKSTIQAGINFAKDGDTVLVAPNTYYEHIDFKGKSITVKSSGGASVTIIDGASIGSVVTFANDEGGMSVLDGFTIQHGSGTVSEDDGNLYGGGIYCYNSSPRIINNVIKENNAYRGGGILCEGDNAFPEIYNNTIVENTGGGIYCKDSAIPTITNNIIANNTAPFGGAVLADFIFPEDEVNYNDAWNNTSPQYYIENEEAPPMSPGVKNIKADPLFADAYYHLQATSPCIDKGTKTNAPTNDFDGEPRPFPSTSTGKVDIGADEFTGSTTTTTTTSSTTTTTCPCPTDDPAKGCIGGQVTSRKTRGAAQGKQVELKKKGMQTLTAPPTGPDGCFSFPNLPPGKYKLKLKGCTGGGNVTVGAGGKIYKKLQCK